MLIQPSKSAWTTVITKDTVNCKISDNLMPQSKFNNTDYIITKLNKSDDILQVGEWKYLLYNNFNMDKDKIMNFCHLKIDRLISL